MPAEHVSRLKRAARKDRAARQRADAARVEFVEALIEARPHATIRELADAVGLSPARVGQILERVSRAA